MSLNEIENRICAAADEFGRKRGDITLIAVSKVQPDDRVQPLLSQGHRIFGENRVQEAAGRWPKFMDSHAGINLHLIGPLQSNKARQAMEMFTTIHSVHRPKLLTTIARLADDLGQCPNLLIQVNTGEEPQKAGILPADTDSFVAECRALDLSVSGLMCIPPVDEEPSLHFALLAKLAGRNGLHQLSMGMSADYESAIALGATHVRVGSAIFGARRPG